jgi:hypothetical protein
MGFTGAKTFTIINDRNETITEFRLTHFMDGDHEKKNKVVTRVKFKAGEEFDEEFYSVSGEDDRWFIQFETLVGGCKMTKSMIANMAEDKDEFKIRITIDEMEVEWKKGEEFDSKKTDIKRVSKIMD